MAEYSITEALHCLYIDPYPTKKFRSIVTQLKNVTIIMEKIHKVRHCFLEDIFKNLKLTEEKTADNNFTNTADVYMVLAECHTVSTFNYLLIRLLYYIIFKLKNCSSDEAPSILHDFCELENCIFDFEKYSIWDYTDMNDIVNMFQEKLIQMVKELKSEKDKDKMHMFNIVRIMIMDFGKHPVYGLATAKYLNEEIKLFYESVKNLEPNAPINAYILENHLTYLYILNDLMGRNFLSHYKENKIRDILAEIRTNLNNLKTLKMNSRQSYLIENILRIIDVFKLQSKN